ncbi:hypothetical protein F5Y16DRAFT_402294 [Xylariaceae sp. FL0255]|nr:hypothetical protein F5Y16DRAFT_402294 [Xylariaceae sp. FL0255]
MPSPKHPRQSKCFDLPEKSRRPNVLFEPKHLAINSADRASRGDPDLPFPMLAMYTDGSYKEEGEHYAGTGVAWKQYTPDTVEDPTVWRRARWEIDTCGMICHGKSPFAEFRAIVRGLDRAAREIKKLAKADWADPSAMWWIRLFVFVDAKDPVQKTVKNFILYGQTGSLGRTRNGRLTALLKKPMDALKGLNVYPEFRWSPAHEGIPGNELADDLARDGRLAITRYPPAIGPLLPNSIRNTRIFTKADLKSASRMLTIAGFSDYDYSASKTPGPKLSPAIDQNIGGTIAQGPILYNAAEHHKLNGKRSRGSSDDGLHDEPNYRLAKRQKRGNADARHDHMLSALAREKLVYYETK